MIIEQHYDEEVLAAFLQEPREAVVRDKHLGSCRLCRRSLDTLRATAGMLHEPAVWQPERPAPSPQATLDFLRDAARRKSEEDNAALAAVRELLGTARGRWPAALGEHPEWRTAGVVRKLIAATDQFNFSSPVDAVELTQRIVELAQSLPDDRHGIRARLVADAWREHAYAKTIVSAYTEAFAAIEEAESVLPASAPECDRARLMLMRAQVLRLVNRPAESAPLARRAARVFARYGEVSRYVSARITEATVLYDVSQYRDSLAVLDSLAQHNVSMDDTMRAMVQHNRALCLRELGDFAAAEPAFVDAVALFEKVGAGAMRAKAHWHLARVLMRQGRHEAALPLLQRLRHEFEDLGMANEAAYVAVDAAETLLVLDRPNEVVQLCHSAMEFFEAAGLTYGPGALTALAWVREAAAGGRLSIADLSKVRGYFDILPKQPTLRFAQPEREMGG